MADTFLFIFFFFLICFTAGLIAPQLFTFLFRKTPSREQAGIVFCILSVVSFSLFHIFSSQQPLLEKGTTTQNPLAFITALWMHPTPTPDPCKKYVGTKLMKYCILGQKAIEKRLAMVLKATLTTDTAFLYVTNPTNTKMDQCTIATGLKPAADSFYSQEFTVASNQTTKVQWNTFTNKKQQSFNYSSSKPKFVSITCTVNNQNEHEAYAL